MLDYLGWIEASKLIVEGVQKTIQSRRVTYDLARQMEEATTVKCSEFADAVIENMKSGR